MTVSQSVRNQVLAAYLAPHPPIILPQIGGASQDADQTIAAMQLAAREVARLAPDTLVIISPHAPFLQDFVYFYSQKILTGDFSQFGHADISLSRRLDSELAEAISAAFLSKGYSGGFLTREQEQQHKISGRLDHGVLVPLYFLGEGVPSARLVALSCADLPAKQAIALGESVAEAIAKTQRRVVLIASGDLSHKVNEKSPYGSCPEGAKFDQELIEILRTGDLNRLTVIRAQLRERAAECGYRPIVSLMGVFGQQMVDVKVLSYEAPYGIGYGVVQFTPIAHPESDHSVPVQIAKRIIEQYVRTGQRLTVRQLTDLDLTPWLARRAGTFVSLHRNGQLRGCIGTISATTPDLVAEISQNAISAATRDPRFDSVTPEELEDLEIKVDVLEASEPIENLKQLNPHQYGVIVSQGSRRGLLLPDLEGVDTIREQLEIACHKAGIDP